mgnify:CR=1 FL=1
MGKLIEKKQRQKPLIFTLNLKLLNFLAQIPLAACNHDLMEKKLVMKNLFLQVFLLSTLFVGCSEEGSTDPSLSAKNKTEDGSKAQDGLSAYEIWSKYNTGTEEDFLKSLMGPEGKQGEEGLEGLSAYEIWSRNNKGTEEDFFRSLIGYQGQKGETGEKGDMGEKGETGTTGKSAYEIWSENNTGTEEDFLNSLSGSQGETGATGQAGYNSLIKMESCKTGYKVHSGLDTNRNGILDSDEQEQTLEMDCVPDVVTCEGDFVYAGSPIVNPQSDPCTIITGKLTVQNQAPPTKRHKVQLGASPLQIKRQISHLQKSEAQRPLAPNNLGKISKKFRLPNRLTKATKSSSEPAPYR